MTARERALEALTRIIAANGDADPGCTARECLVALEGLGYRPTEARPAVGWPVHGAGAEPPADLLQQLRADLGAKAERAAAERNRDDVA
jgi:hypothetical protein